MIRKSMTVVLILLVCAGLVPAGTYNIVDTGQDGFYDADSPISAPSEGEAFYGQDAAYEGNQPSYTDNGDGTVTDNVTGLVWVKTPNLDNKYTFEESVAGADTCSVGGYDDWRLPTIKELYSLINFEGSTFNLIPYIDTSYFDFRWGDESQGERIIDAQYWSANQYVGQVFGGVDAVFGVNFADGRIKGYPRDEGMNGPMTQFVRYVRGNPDYGINDFTDNGDGTITDAATGLGWQAADDGVTRNWEDALAYAENLELAGHSDWRLPNAKELQSLLDYTRAPEASDPDKQTAAIDPVFELTEEQSWFWSSTTHLDGPDASFACYVCFGQAFGYMESPPNSGNYEYQDVHGAGAQRSDPKSGDPEDWPYGNGPQGDEVRIYNYVLAVREATTSDIEESDSQSRNLDLDVNSPFTSQTTISYQLPASTSVELSIYDTTGRLVRILVSGTHSPGTYRIAWDGTDNSGATSGSGVYFCQLKTAEDVAVERVVLSH